MHSLYILIYVLIVYTYIYNLNIYVYIGQKPDAVAESVRAQLSCAEVREFESQANQIDDL